MLAYRFEAPALTNLIAALHDRGYRVVAPTAIDGALVLDEIDSTAQLPRGYIDEQEKGTYRLKKTDQETYFNVNVGPHSPKKFLFPSNRILWRSRQQDGKLDIIPTEDQDPPTAFLGLRACEVAAIGIQDKVLAKGPFADSLYTRRREQALIIPVDCTRAGNTCFCTSMGGGPAAKEGYHLALTEVYSEDTHYFLARPGDGDIGLSLLEAIGAKPASEADIQMGHKLVDQAASSMGRDVNTTGLAELLPKHREDPYWEEVGARCMNCTNCTMVCPTCFCFTVDDVNDLTGTESTRTRQWDSCFNLSFSYQHGGSIRTSNKSRYRHWLTHKFSTWHDQFGSSGCVGCGRCVTWCPVGIDVTEEVKRFQEKDHD